MGGRYCLRNPYADLGTPRITGHSGSIYAASVCGSHVLRVAFTLQIIAQKNADPTVASLLLSLESVFSVLAGWVILHQSLSIRELFGCVLMFGAIILAQLPEKTKA